VELEAVLRWAAETARPGLDARRHELKVSLPPEPMRLLGDPVRLAQVFANLLNNAAKYTDPKGRVSLTAVQDGDEVVVRVRDNGIGIAPEMLPRVFDLFVQCDSTGRSQGGLGIGLTLVKSLVEGHGGRVSASSPGPGKGSEFVIRLPCLPSVAGLEGHETTPRQPPLPTPARRRILVVDDNVDAAESLVTLLRMDGHEVRVAYNGPAALETARSDPPEITFLDIGMPGMDGNEVARRFRQDGALAKVTLVALTGWGKEEDRECTHAAGFDHHLVKPVDPGVLRKLLACGELQRTGLG
jgi:CheY-like chemotaxis protein